MRKTPRFAILLFAWLCCRNVEDLHANSRIFRSSKSRWPLSLEKISSKRSHTAVVRTCVLTVHRFRTIDEWGSSGRERIVARLRRIIGKQDTYALLIRL